MADIVLGGVGAAVGSLYGNPMLGFSIGMSLGGLLFPPDLGTIEQGRLTEARIQGASYGDPIPLAWGRFRSAGEVIWASAWEATTTTSGGGKGKPKTKKTTYRGSFAILIKAGPMFKLRKIIRDGEVCYDDTGGSLVVADDIDPDNIAIYYGSPTQGRDPTIEAQEGTANTPAYRNRSYVVFKDYSVPLGGRLPNFEFEYDVTEDSPTLDTVLEELFEQVEADPSDLDFAEVAAIEVDGLFVGNRTQLSEVLRKLEQAYKFDLVEVDGTVKTILRGATPTETIDEQYLGATSGQSDSDEKVVIARAEEEEIPRQIDVVYPSESAGFQTLTQHAIRQYGGTIESETIALPVVLTDDEAKSLAVIGVHLAWLQRQGFHFRLPWRYLYLAPGDIVTLPTKIGDMTVRIVEQTMNLLGPVEFFALEEVPSLYSLVTTGQSGGGGGTVVVRLGTDFILVDTVALTDEDADYVGFYSVAGGGSPWPGCDIECEAPFVRTLPGNVPTENVAFHDIAAAMGETESNCAAPSDPEKWDEVNTIDVNCRTGTLSSATEEDVLNGANVIVVDQEIMQFVTATPLGGGSFRLSKLLRGRRGTEWAMGHTGPKPWFMPALTTTERTNVPVTEVGVDHTYNAVEVGKVYVAPDVPATQDLTVEGNSRKPLSVVHVTSSRDGSNNLTIDWIRRARKEGGWNDFVDVPLDETAETYEIDVYDAGWSSVLRTISVTAPTASYTAAEQTTDGLTPGDPVNVKIYQTSDVIGRGFERQETV